MLDSDLAIRADLLRPTATHSEATARIVGCVLLPRT